MQLETRFQECRPRLRARLGQATTLEEMIAAIQAEIDQLAAEYTQGLTVQQVRVALPMFESVRHLLGAVRAIRLLSPLPRAAEPSQRLLLFGMLDRLLERVLGRRNPSPESADLARGESQAEAGRLSLETVTYLDHLGQALQAIDEAVAEVATPSPPDHTGQEGLEQYHQLLEFLQELAADALAGEGPALLKRVRQLPRILEAYGVRVESFQEGGQPSGLAPGRLFEFETSVDPLQRACTTLAPALVQGTEVLLRGRVVEPSQKEEGTR
jgi:hypothetical protein